MPTSGQQQLNKAQVAAETTIANYGALKGYDSSEIDVAVNIAFAESSLGTNETGSGSSAAGMFQYTAGTWAMYHSSLNINSPADQITAIYEDIDRDSDVYFDALAAGSTVLTGYSFGEFFETLHHYGESSTQYAKGKAVYDIAQTAVGPLTVGILKTGQSGTSEVTGVSSGAFFTGPGADIYLYNGPQSGGYAEDSSYTDASGWTYVVAAPGNSGGGGKSFVAPISESVKRPIINSSVELLIHAAATFNSTAQLTQLNSPVSNQTYSPVMLLPSVKL